MESGQLLHAHGVRTSVGYPWDAGLGGDLHWRTIFVVDQLMG